MNTLYKITFGTEFDKNGQRFKLTAEQISNLRTLVEDIVDYFGDMTQTEHQSLYKHNNGETVSETSLSYEIIASDKDRGLIVSVAEDIKEILNQESVLLTETKINEVFI